jgi:rhamnosyltransferase
MIAKKNHKIAVLMATFNGKHWLSEQVESILQQVNVDLTLFVSDDHSTDGTLEYLKRLAESNSRVVILPQTAQMGSAGKNFYRLVCDVDTDSFDYVAFADQDDIWNLDKLSRHIHLIQSENAECVSSNVLAFWENGKTKLIDKSQPQKAYDYLFESAGPGCSFLMTPWLLGEVKRQIQGGGSAKYVVMHDWLTYAICRAHGKRWVIDSIPSMQYRQHRHNVIGANNGLKAIFARVKKIHDGWYRHQVLLISQVLASIDPSKTNLFLEESIRRYSLSDRLRLLPFAIQGRRKPSDRLVLILSMIFFIF